MEQELYTNEQLNEWMANPGSITGNDAAALEALVRRYPYSQPLRLMLAKAAAGASDIATAALYADGQLVYRVLHDPGSLVRAKFDVVSYDGAGTASNEPEPLDETALDEVGTEEAAAGWDLNEPDSFEEEEVYEEIGEVNIDDYRLTTESVVPDAEAPAADPAIENLATTDFFAFQDNFKVEAAPEEAPAVEEYAEQAVLEQEENVVSKYDDDKLPYTFLWWLAKTRKEHEQIFQPYASPRKNKPAEEGKTISQSPQGELQQQYVEHIFHVQSAFGDEETSDALPGGSRKNYRGDEIIETFIKNEPQISPPKPEQINNENKARKSAEDNSDLVSETLAKIYIEQMLYDKAIETYEKLSLMFPEKSRYFADLVQSIEKKI